ncbi:hypothetical protein KC366_g1697 [Hortaea werneckii]|uniref:Uncharacterized protein n=1 Tax=Hortaea werneckii TaxID=91943 RepID=A0A3M7IJD6_HORWE|nr:hypothetical protein KC358_g153 [Hortaea werneckii]KAI6853135.1 hypothetical protein KC350_g252 [Hortaea werneckii]KAI6945432.1 hypothetical protein KC341_g121 [Hortaea werneckii]KAI6950035.1 hypothetical protein KC348_g924 [Hortaea werneckii]KAI7000774.1 hypothetical protein KC329_g269 [Hortaea werneckii]
MAFRRSQPYASYDTSWRTPVSPIVTGAHFPRTSQVSQLHDAEELREPFVSPIMSRSPSVTSDRFSTVSGLTSTTLFQGSGNLQNINPQPAYVAPFGASQVVSEHHATGRRASSSEDEGARVDKDDVKFSAPALSLVNAFLDYLLLSFLSSARSTSLYALKPAVTEVLRSRLARDAIVSAEEELQELLGGGEEEEEENTKQNAAEHNRRWDLELVWKRTRLRVMVYMRLGEMEDDDEERYIKEEELFHGSERRFSQTSGLVSWAAAIFLTGVLEYVAEQTLQVAGAAAHTRTKRQSRSASRVASPDPSITVGSATGKLQPVTVEEHDVEKVALNSTIGRLWRTWRKALRANAAAANPSSPTRRLTRSGNEAFYPPMSTRRGSPGMSKDSSPTRGTAPPRVRLDEVPELQYPEHVLASNIPLPMGNSRRDVDEIEVPGLARDPDAPDQDDVSSSVARRNSLTGPVSSKTTDGLPTPDSSSIADNRELAEKPTLTRKRSVSVPTPARTPLPIEEMPGAFPQDIAEEPEQRDEREEQKSNADEMAPHKRASIDATAFLDKTESPSGSEVVPDSHGTELLGGAVAAASVAAEAGGPAVRSSKEHDRNHPDISTLNQSNGKNVEELDKRKSLMDMKDLIASDSESPPGPVLAREPSSDESRKSSESKKSYTLRKESVPHQSPATRQHMPDNQSQPLDVVGNGIGVAATSDVVAGGGAKRDARGPAKRPSQLSLGTNSAHRKGLDSSMVPDSPSQNSPRNFLESRALASNSDLPSSGGKLGQPSPNEQTRAAPTEKVQKRRSIPGAAFTSATASPLAERNPHRQSWSSQLQQQQDAGAARPVSISAFPGVPTGRHNSIAQSPDASIQEHPVVQRMASLKCNDRKSSSADLDSDSGLTSASIRGPQDFDMFVQGGETVKYTLTPEKVRESSVQNGRAPPSKRASGVDLTSAPAASRNSAIMNDTRASRSQTTVQTTSDDIDAELERQTRLEKRRSVSKPPLRNTSTHRRSGLMAREPQVVTESTRDFADFIRSTGPQSESQEVRPVMNPASVSTTSLHSMRSAHINGSSTSLSSSAISTDKGGRERAKSVPRARMESENIPPVPPMPTKASRTNMQARAATGAGGSNADLIDFIRSGPEEEGQRRISRSVAPFRSTMDSDQFNEMGFQSASRPDLKLDTGGNDASGSISSRSHRGSTGRPPSSGMNTRAGAMLAANADGTKSTPYDGRSQSRTGRSNGAAPALPTDEGGAMPARKQHRNKDPYAIDYSDEDEDLLTALPKNNRQEESLADFLRNNEPPEDNAPRPLVNGGSARARQPMGRSNASSMSSLRSASANDAARTKSMQNPGGPRPGYTPSMRSTASGSPARRPSRPSSQQGGASALPPMPGSKPRMEAKSPGATGKPPNTVGPDGQQRLGAFHKQSNTKDLADFLKNSGPEEDEKSAPAPSIGRQSKLNPRDAEKARKKAEKDSLKSQDGKKPSFFGRLTGGKRKTWLNMP